MRIVLNSILLLVLMLLASCSHTYLLNDNEVLLNRRKLKIDNKKIDREEVLSLIRQKPNKRLLVIGRFHLLLYNMAGKKESNFRNRLRNLGEAPVVLDTLLTNRSVRQLQLYLNNKGYYHHTVVDSLKVRRKKGKQIFVIQSGKPFYIQQINYSIEDKTVANFILADTANALVKSGEIFDTDMLQKERDRITALLRNNGYYEFQKEYIVFNADTLGKPLRVNLELVIPLLDSKSHPQFIINNVTIYPTYDLTLSDTLRFNKTLVTIERRRNAAYTYPYWFVSDSVFLVNPRTITQAIFFKKGDYYSLTDVQQSYKRLSELSIYKYVNISFVKEKYGDDTLFVKQYGGAMPLTARVLLSHLPKQMISVETEGVNTGGDLGLVTTLAYMNRNVFKRAETLELRWKGALEAQNVEAAGLPKSKWLGSLPFNTVETGIIASVKFPRFLIPIREEYFPRYFKPKTTLSLAFNYQQRPDYIRYLSGVVFGYDWRESKYKRHIFNPVELSSVAIDKDSLFEQRINALNDIRIRNAYSNYLISAMSYSFIFNNQQINKLSNFSFLRVNAEVAGNILYGIHTLIKAPLNTNNAYELMGIRFAQYVRLETDYRHYFVITERNRVVTRMRVGLGTPYANSDVLPFEKAFFAGGANSIRGWKLRSLGPGAFSDTLNNRFDKTGDFLLEMNLEYRFPIYKYFNGALFVDAGNVWMTKPNETFPNGDFQWQRVVSEIAMSTGLGIRYDFKYFIIRLDMAVPVRNPAKSIAERWVLDEIQLKKVNFNVGIGYPF